MSQGEQRIVCRRCNENIALATDSCPHCGASVRNSGLIVAVTGFGGLLAVGALFDLSQLWFFGAIGLAIAAIGGYLLYDKRRRMIEAAEQAEAEFDMAEEMDL